MGRRGAQPARGKARRAHLPGRVAAWIGVVLLAFGPVTPTLARAQVLRTRILRGLEVHALPDGVELRVQFNVPVRVVRHSPAARGTSVEIQLDPVTTDPTDTLAALASESLQPPREANTPIEAVSYLGNNPSGRYLDVSFTRLVAFEVEGGRDLRSVIVRVHEPARARPQPPVAPGAALPGPTPTPAATAPGTPAEAPSPEAAASVPAPNPPAPAPAIPAGPAFAIQLYAGPADQPPPRLPALPSLRGRLVYSVPFRKDGDAWRRLRVGLYASAADAERDRRALAAAFPGAFVVPAGGADRSAALLARPLGEPVPAPQPIAQGTPAPAPAVDAITAPVAPRAATPAPVAPGATAPSAPPSTPSESAALLQRGRDALAAGNLPLAISLFTKLTTGPESPESAEALELMGLARERAGQLAQAKATYDQYLERYPDSEGATRVRQRLDAMLTARSASKGRLREARARDALRWDVFGSLSSSYRRSERYTQALGSSLNDSSIYNGLFAATRVRSERYDVQAQVNGSYLFDFLGDGRSDDERRLTSLFVEVDSLQGPVSGIFGRQSGNSRGVIGRMDGLLASWRFDEHWSVSAVGGFPVDFDSGLSVDTSRRFGGLSVDATGLLPGVDAQLYAIYQDNDGFTDREAVGGELRYFGDGRYVSALVDYDVHYRSLNTAFLTASWQVLPKTGINLYGDYRNSPVLTTRNALIGETVGSLDELRALYSDKQIEQLAEARTGKSKVGTLGVTQQLTERFQLAADVTAAKFDFTDPAAALAEITNQPVIDSFEGSGLEMSYFTQLIGSGLVRDGDVYLLGLRYTDGETSNRAAALLSARFPLLSDLRLRLNPRVDVIQQRFDSRDPLLFVRPGLRIDYRVGHVFLDADFTFEWVLGDRTPDSGGETGYILGVGARYDF